MLFFVCSYVAQDYVKARLVEPLANNIFIDICNWHFERSCSNVLTYNCTLRSCQECDSKAQAPVCVFLRFYESAGLLYRKKKFRNMNFFAIMRERYCATFHTIMRFPQCGSAHPFAPDERFLASPRASHSHIRAKSHGNSRSGAWAQPQSKRRFSPGHEQNEILLLGHFQ